MRQNLVVNFSQCTINLINQKSLIQKFVQNQRNRFKYKNKNLSSIKNVHKKLLFNILNYQKLVKLNSIPLILYRKKRIKAQLENKSNNIKKPSHNQYQQIEVLIVKISFVNSNKNLKHSEVSYPKMQLFQICNQISNTMKNK